MSSLINQDTGKSLIIIRISMDGLSVSVRQYDILIVGGGLSGLRAGLELSKLFDSVFVTDSEVIIDEVGIERFMGETGVWVVQL